MFVKVTENGTRDVAGTQYAYAVKALILNSEPDEINISLTIVPFSDAAVSKLKKFFEIYTRQSKYEPIKDTFVIHDNFVITGDKKGIEKMVDLLMHNCFISSDTSSRVKDKLHALEVPAVSPAHERSPLLKK